jgi:hypothetical protein
MKPRVLALVALGAVLIPLPAIAQEDDEGPVGIAAYYYCNQATEQRADEIFEEYFAPILDKHVEAGHLTAWGWLSHRVGGKWRRLEYMFAPTREILLSTRGAIIEEFQADDSPLSEEFSQICPSHDDYIWNHEAGSEPIGAATRPEWSISMYFECDFAREDLADEIYENVFGPVFDEAVADGTISGWNWLSHDVGGKYRRLGTITGTSPNAVLDGRDAVFGAINEMAEGALNVFSETCNSHTDYLWRVQMARP